MKRIVIAGSGNAALCAGIAALEQGADVLLLEKASADEAGGNSRYTAGAMRFAYQSHDWPVSSWPWWALQVVERRRCST